MTIEKLERVMWRMRSLNQNTDKFSVAQLRRAIMYEVGTDVRTYKANKKALVDIGWIKSRGSRWIVATNKDL